MLPPITYYGGTAELADRIAVMLPEHTHYVEPFAGFLAVLLAKRPSWLQTVNDLDRDLMTFWKVLRERATELARVCTLTPHSRAEQESAYGDRSGRDDLERARRGWVQLTQGRTGTLRRTGWRFDAGDAAHTSMPTRLAGYLERIYGVAERLADTGVGAKRGGR